MASAQSLLEVEQRLAESKARISALEICVEELREQLAWAERFNEEMRASLSWRITAPLRALKRLR
ncbi:MAG: hypothetical protein ACYCX7_10830 [Solirubrobacteraceae bacterium]